MASVGVRSPYFFYKSVAGSLKLDIYIDGALEYSILKNKDASGYVTIEIAELIRDHIDVYYTGNLMSGGALSVDVWLYYTTYSGLNGTGTASGPTLDSEFSAFDGYAYYSEERNQFIYPSTAPLITTRVIWAPENTAGYVYYTSGGTVLRADFGATGTLFTAGGAIFRIKRFPCTKYTPVELVFVNRYGVIQQLWFFAKTIESVSSTKDSYKSNSLFVDGAYQYERHQKKQFDVNGSSKYSLSTGYITEDYNESMKELLLSEQVWAHLDDTIYPVNVVSSNVSYRTSLNDKLVAYTVEIEQANDLISTMR